MCNYVNEVLSNIKEIFKDIDVVKGELDNTKNEYENLDAFLKYIDNDVYKIGEYDKQDFIYNYLDKINSTIDEYKANIYLLKGRDIIGSLPQFGKSLDYINELLDYFKKIYQILKDKIDLLENNYSDACCAKKYNDLLEQNELIDDPNEFIEFINSLKLDLDVKEGLYKEVIANNVNFYLSNTASDKYEIDKKYDMYKINNIIHENKDLLSKDNIKKMKDISRKINLKKNVENLLDDENLKICSKEDIIFGKDVWLMLKIIENYKSCEFGKVSKYLNEYDALMEIKNETGEGK